MLDYLTWLNLGCWAVCFWWMHRISSRQDLLLRQLKDQGQRIETLSREEHDLIKEVHPQVGEIKHGMNELAEVLQTSAEAATPSSGKTKPSS